MSRRLARAGALFAAATLLHALAACSVDPKANPSFGCEGCQTSCVMGFCLQREDGGLGGGGALDGGADAGADAGAAPAPEACTEPGKTEFCYDGPSATATTGTCKAGMRVCGQGFWSACLGQVLPTDELCNRQDDDCDGDSDEDVELGTCSTGQLGECDVGMLRCETGIAVCARASDPGAEQCNGRDDDCDGDIDEDVSTVCYPAAPDGCVDDGAGGFTCMGLCVPGVASCVDGVPEACAGVVEPVAEKCTTSGPAQDEDCDGQADNGCSCTGGDSQPCYSGPLETLDVGICKAGSQRCDAATSSYGACMGEVLPGVESCDNDGADDDCNGTADDVRQRGAPCTVEDVKGVCRDGTHECVGGSLQCQGPAPTDETCNGFDDDCDGKTDEGLLDADPNCGECGHDCAKLGADTAMTCCGGQCIDTNTDAKHCGRCDNACGQDLDCCGGKCVDLQRDPMNCSACGRMCPLNGCCNKGNCAGIVLCQ